MGFSNRNLWAAVLLLLLMGGLTIPRLYDQGLWVDEAWTAAFTAPDSPVEVTAQLVEDRHPPLYFLTIWAWQQAAGNGEIALRLPSVFALILGAACLYQWSKTLFGIYPALAGLLLLALADKLIDFSIEARHYTWLMLWSTTSGWMLARWLGFRNGTLALSHVYQPKDAIAYTLLVIAGLYTHLFMGMILAVQGLYALIILTTRHRSIRAAWHPFKKLVALWLLAGLAYLPWLPVVIYQFQKGGGIQHAVPFRWDFLRLLPEQYLGEPLTLFAGLLLVGIAAPFLRSAWLSPRSQAVLMPTLGVSLPLAVMLALKFASHESNFLTERNLSILIPPAAMLMGVGVMVFQSFTRWALVLLLLVNGLLTTHSHQYQIVEGEVLPAPSGINPPWRDISRVIAGYAPPGEPILIEAGGGGDDIVLDYHLKQRLGEDVHLTSLVWFIYISIDPLALLRFEVLDDARGFWYVYWSGNRSYIDALPSWGYTQTATFTDTFFHDTIYVYRYDSNRLLDEQMTVYGNRVVLHQTHTPDQGRAGDDLIVNLWWSVPEAIPEDYTVSVFLLNQSGQLVAQHDSQPQNNQSPISTWAANTLVYDRHPLEIPETLPAGMYQVAVKVYRGGEVLHTSEDGEWLVIGEVEVGSH